jgi:hypothetical protein
MVGLLALVTIMLSARRPKNIHQLMDDGALGKAGSEIAG